MALRNCPATVTGGFGSLGSLGPSCGNGMSFVRLASWPSRKSKKLSAMTYPLKMIAVQGRSTTATPSRGGRFPALYCPPPAIGCVLLHACYNFCRYFGSRLRAVCLLLRGGCRRCARRLRLCVRLVDHFLTNLRSVRREFGHHDLHVSVFEANEIALRSFRVHVRADVLLVLRKLRPLTRGCETLRNILSDLIAALFELLPLLFRLLALLPILLKRFEPCFKTRVDFLDRLSAFPRAKLPKPVQRVGHLSVAKIIVWLWLGVVISLRLRLLLLLRLLCGSFLPLLVSGVERREHFHESTRILHHQSFDGFNALNARLIFRELGATLFYRANNVF